eukprot:4439808-Pyramimonas_sp.AAC.2
MTLRAAQPSLPDRPIRLAPEGRGGRNPENLSSSFFGARRFFAQRRALGPSLIDPARKMAQKDGDRALAVISYDVLFVLLRRISGKGGA